MADLRYVLYDTAVFGATANNENTLFQVAQGGDGTHTESFTNSRGAGQLPQEESFACDRIGVMPDHTLVEADIEAVWRGAFLEVRVADKTMLKAPLSAFAYRASYGGHFAQGTAANRVLIGKEGNGYDLDIPIVIPGGTSFKIRVVQGPAVAANSNMKVFLLGTLTIP